MSYAQAKAATDPIAADQRFAYGNAVVYVPRSVVVTLKTLRAEVSPGVPFFSKAKVAAVAAVIKAADPVGYDILTSEGIDPNHPDAQQLLASLPTATNGVVDATDCDKIRDLARTVQGPRWQAEWQLPAWDADTLAKLDQWAAWEALAADVDTMLTWIDALRSIDAAAIPALLGAVTAPTQQDRDALVNVVQAYRAKIAAGDDVSDMPATAAAAWATRGV